MLHLATPILNIAALLFITAVGPTLTLPRPDDSSSENTITVPDMETYSIEGLPISLHPPENKLQLVLFWDAGDDNAEGLAKEAIVLYERFHDHGLNVLGVYPTLSEDKVIQFSEKWLIPWPQVMNQDVDEPTPMQIFKVKEIPTNFLIDSAGKIIANNLEGEEAHEIIAEALDVSLDNLPMPEPPKEREEQPEPVEYTPPPPQDKKDDNLEKEYDAKKLISGGFKSDWSPDGSKIVYGKPEGKGIQIYDLKTGIKGIMTDKGKDPAWSPDGKHIAYVVEPTYDDFVNEEVWIIDIEGTNAHKLMDGGFPSWSTDGKTVFASSRKDNKVYSIRVDDTDAKPEIYYDEPISWYPAISPDGSKIAYGANEELIIVDRLSGDILLQRTVPEQAGLLLNWSPDGKKLGFGGYGDFGLWVLDVENKKIVELADGIYTMPAWSPDGAKLSFDFRGRPEREIWMIETDTLNAALTDAPPIQETGPITLVIDPHAEEIMKGFAKHLEGFKSIQFEMNIEFSISGQGQEREMKTTQALYIQKPDKLACVNTGGDFGITLVSDGKTLKAYLPMFKTYYEKEGPESIDALQSMDLPGALRNSPAFPVFILDRVIQKEKNVMKDIKKLLYKGKKEIDGADYHVVRISVDNGDVEYYFTTDEKPLLNKIIPDVSTLLDEMPPAEIEVKIECGFENWKFGEEIPATAFDFAPPSDAVKVDSLEAIARPPSSSPPTLRPASIAGQTAPDFSLTTLDDGEITLSEQRDHIVILDFWATWCPPCRKAMPILEKVAEEYKEKGVKLIAVNQQESSDTIRKYLEENDLHPTVALDANGEVGKLYSVEGIPKTVIIDQKGIIQKTFDGFSPNFEMELKKQIDQLLKTGSVIRVPEVALYEPAGSFTCIDLTDYYNAELTDAWHKSQGYENNTLASLPTGINNYNGVEFKTDGILQLTNPTLHERTTIYPEKVEGIKIDQSFQRLHVLHAAAWQSQPGTVVGKYILNYADGGTHEIEIKYGEDVVDWWAYGGIPTKSVIAWRGTNPQATIRLFRNTWENPKPDSIVDSLDYISTMDQSVPYLVALTVED